MCSRWPCRWLCLLLWRALAIPASLLGLVPLRLAPAPTPWPHWAACTAAAANVALLLTPKLMLSDVYFKNSPFIAFVSICMGSGSTAAIVYATLGRRRLSHALQCVLVYCRRHPLSARAWRWVLASTAAAALYTPLLAMDAGILLATKESGVSLLARVYPHLWYLLYKGSMFSLLALPRVVLWGLAADLRLDCQRHSPLGAGQDAPSWRTLRVRQRLLHDMALALNATEQWAILFYILLSGCYLSLSFGAIFSILVASSLVARSLAICARAAVDTLYLVLLFRIHEWMSVEVRGTVGARLSPPKPRLILVVKCSVLY